ncbi:MAG TPA: hypothetical protein VIN71_01375, partial [Pseudomonadales bacterium]
MRLISVGLLLLAQAGHAADDATARAMKLHEKHYYDAAAQQLRAAMPAMDAAQLVQARLALGMMHLGSAMLYRELNRTALVIEADYLSQLGKQKTARPSQYVELYLGQVLQESGRIAEGVVHLRKFVAQGNLPALDKVLGNIELGVAYSRQKQIQAAQQEWSGKNMKRAEIKAALAGAFALAGLGEKQPEQLADEALHELQVQQQKPAARLLRNVLRAYAHAGATDKALQLLAGRQWEDAAYVEELEASKSIRFYDSSLLQDMSRVHLDAAIASLEQAARDEKLAAMAAYYLTGAYLLRGNAELAQLYASKVLQSALPLAVRNIAQIDQGSEHYLKGRREEAQAVWSSLAEKAAGDPQVLAYVLQACTQAASDCAKPEKLAVAALEHGEGKKFFGLSAALGRYYLQRRDYSRALQYMEGGRDKANKNKIEANDPLLLV